MDTYVRASECDESLQDWWCVAQGFEPGDD